MSSSGATSGGRKSSRGGHSSGGRGRARGGRRGGRGRSNSNHRRSNNASNPAGNRGSASNSDSTGNKNDTTRLPEMRDEVSGKQLGLSNVTAAVVVYQTMECTHTPTDSSAFGFTYISNFVLFLSSPLHFHGCWILSTPICSFAGSLDCIHAIHER